MCIVYNFGKNIKINIIGLTNAIKLIFVQAGTI